MFNYRAYQLRITSDVPLPELAEASEGGDVEVRLGRPDAIPPLRNIDWEPSIAKFSFPGAARFSVEDGRLVRITPDLQPDLPLIRLYVQGMMLAALLYQRGFFVLHASVVQCGQEAIAFVGPIGAGKSTLAAALHARGYTVVADDNAAILQDTSGLRVTPAYASLKIYPAIAAKLGYEPAGLQTMHVSQAKKAQPLDSFAQDPVRLARIYVLTRQQRPGIDKLRPSESVQELLRHSVPMRWGLRGDGAHLSMCGRIASEIPLYRVPTFAGLDEIHELADRIEEHGAGLSGICRGSALSTTCVL